MTTAERLRAEGWEEGWAEGWKEGWAEGRAEGRRWSLLILLRSASRELPPDIEARIEAADVDRLAGWAARILTGDPVEAVFTP